MIKHRKSLSINERIKHLAAFGNVKKPRRKD